MSDVKSRIEEEIKANPVLLYVKGNRLFPQCGFSKAVMDIFQHMEVPFETRDVLEDPELREGIKQFTNWPTIPQIFLKGEFIGGCDIVRDLFQKGELEPMVKKALAAETAQ